MQAEAKDSINDKIFKLRSYYVQKFPDKVLSIEKDVELIKRGINYDEHIISLKEALHNLSGTSGTYGFQDLGDLCKDVLDDLIIKTRDAQELNSAVSHQIELEVFKVVDKILDIYESYDKNLLEPQKEEICKSDLEYSRVLYVSNSTLSEDNDFVSFLKRYSLIVDIEKPEIENIIKYFKKNQPATVIVNMDEAVENINLFTKLNDLKNSYLQVVHFLFISEKSDIKTRLKAIKWGADSFFAYPNDMMGLDEYISYNVLYKDNSAPKVLIVNDDTVKAKEYANMLQSASMETCIIEKIEEISRHLIEFSPDLILLEMYMDDCSGVDLAKVIKQQSAYENIPIIFTSYEGGKEKYLLAIQNEGEDYFEVPIEPAFLIQSVSIRAERMKRTKMRVETDGLTRLYNQRKTKELLHIEFSRAKRYGKNFVFGMLDIDFFKRVNDTYGHLIGDSVLRSFASLLKNRCRKTDIVGRYGGEEFVVILSETSMYFAEIVFNKLREEFERIVHNSGGTKFNVTFSCGIVSSDEFDSALELNIAADKALYKAKEDGRNRVVVYSKDIE